MSYLAAAAIAFQSEEVSGWGGLALFGVNAAGIIVAGLLVLYLRFGVGKVEEEVENRHIDGREAYGRSGALIADREKRFVDCGYNYWQYEFQDAKEPTHYEYE